MLGTILFSNCLPIAFKALSFEYLYRNIELSSILSEEQDAFDNMPEGLQSSYRGMCSEDAIDNMEETSEKLDEVIELLGDIV